jgi:hypothetical protein
MLPACEGCGAGGDDPECKCPPGTYSVDVEVCPVSELKEVETEREDWRGKAERYLSEWRNRDHDVVEADAVASEKEAAAEMWRGRAEQAEQQAASMREAIEKAKVRLEAMQVPPRIGKSHTAGWLAGEAHELAKELRCFLASPDALGPDTREYREEESPRLGVEEATAIVSAAFSEDHDSGSLDRAIKRLGDWVDAQLAAEENWCDGSGLLSKRGEAIPGAGTIGPPESEPCPGCPRCELPASVQEQPVRCGGDGALAKNFGIDSPGKPEIVSCPGCPHCQPQDKGLIEKAIEEFEGRAKEGGLSPEIQGAWGHAALRLRLLQQGGGEDA